MANTGIRQLTTVVGGYAKRIWYSLNGTTPTNELMSIDDTGKFKCISEQITGLAGAGNRMMVADASGNLSASLQVETGTWTPVLRALGSGVAVAGASNSGRYTKLGKLVMFSADVEWTSINGTISGRRVIEGLPHASASSGAHGSAGHGDFTGLVCSANRSLSLIVASSSSFIYLGEGDLQTGGSYFQTITINNSGTILGINGCYYTD